MHVDLDDGRSLPSFPDSIDVLVNAAGIPPREGEEARILRINTLALIRLSRHLLPNLAERARIVNVASKAGSRWRENLDQVGRLLSRGEKDDLTGFVSDEAIDPVRAYDLSKEAVIVWTRAMTGWLLERGIRMNCVSPAAVETPILGDFVGAFGERATRGIAMTGRSGRPEEVAEVIAFLADPVSEWVRGANIECDGGLSAMLDAKDLKTGRSVPS